MTAKEFCTYTDHKCPLNPISHDRGCELCVKNVYSLMKYLRAFSKKYLWKNQKIISTLSKALQIL